MAFCCMTTNTDRGYAPSNSYDSSNRIVGPGKGMASRVCKVMEEGLEEGSTLENRSVGLQERGGGSQPW
jgi:hypothetical protein